MKISEIFFSIQGEGRNLGLPSVFVRVFGCNLACIWCDSRFSWDPKYAEFSEMSLEKIIQTIRSFPARNVIFTGGEPALFQKEIREIVKALPEDFSFEIETNGTQPIQDDFWDIITISPKMANSENRNAEIRANSFPEKTVWKFVVKTPEDAKEILDFHQKYKIPADTIFIMPEGSTRKALEKTEHIALDMALKNGFRFSPRAHIWIFDNERGR